MKQTPTRIQKKHRRSNSSHSKPPSIDVAILTGVLINVNQFPFLNKRDHLLFNDITPALNYLAPIFHVPKIVILRSMGESEVFDHPPGWLMHIPALAFFINVGPPPWI